MKVLVCGGRDFNDRESVFHELHCLAEKHGFICVIEGGATGADALAREWASLLGHDQQTYRARWGDIHRPGAVLRYRRDGTPYDAAAGPIRNQRMLNESKPDLVLAFAGASGTMDMIDRARAAGVSVRDFPMTTLPQYEDGEEP